MVRALELEVLHLFCIRLCTPVRFKPKLIYNACVRQQKEGRSIIYPVHTRLLRVDTRATSTNKEVNRTGPPEAMQQLSSI